VRAPSPPDSFRSVLWRRFTTARPTDWQVREAGLEFETALRLARHSASVELEIAYIFRQAVDSDPRLFCLAELLLDGLAARRVRESRSFQRSAELLRSNRAERELGLLEDQRRNRAGMR
jgi:hypothetical protein